MTPSGSRLSFAYNDAAQLITSQVYINTNPATTPTKTITFGRDDGGRLTSYNDGTTNATYTYDLLDRVTNVATNFGPFTKTYSYTYFDNGWIKSYTNPENITYNYGYQADGSLSSVSIPGEGQITLSDYQWLASKQMTLPGGINITAVYDELLRLESYQMQDTADQSIAQGQYTYDKVNNIDQIITEAEIKDYEYDNLYRLTSANDANLNESLNESFSYDGVGNRLSAANDPIWTYNDKNQLITKGDTTYTYD